MKNVPVINPPSSELEASLASLNRIILDFFAANPMDQLTQLDRRFGAQNRALRKILRDMASRHIKMGKKTALPGGGRPSLVEAFAWEDGEQLRRLVEAYFLFLYAHPRLSPMGGYLASQKRPINWEAFKRWALSAFAAALFPPPKPKESDTFWNDSRLVQFLSLYNRYTRLIRAARSEVKEVRRRVHRTGGTASPLRLAELEVAHVFAVPEHLVGELFSTKREPKVLAFKWIVETMSACGGRNIHGSIHTHEKILKRASARWRRLVPNRALIPIDHVGDLFLLVDPNNKKFRPHLTFPGTLSRGLKETIDIDPKGTCLAGRDSRWVVEALDYLSAHEPPETEVRVTISPDGSIGLSSSRAQIRYTSF